MYDPALESRVYGNKGSDDYRCRRCPVRSGLEGIEVLKRLDLALENAFQHRTVAKEGMNRNDKWEKVDGPSHQLIALRGIVHPCTNCPAQRDFREEMLGNIRDTLHIQIGFRLPEETGVHCCLELRMETAGWSVYCLVVAGLVTRVPS